MKILILTVSAGEGHNAMSRAVSNYLQQTYSDAQILQIDLYKDGAPTKAKKRAKWMVNDGYFKLVKHFLRIANSQYEKLKERNIHKKAPTLRRNFIKPATPDVVQALQTFQPDAVFCAHTYAAIIMSDLRKQGNQYANNARVVTVVSDYDVAPYTEMLTAVDYIITPTDDFDDVLLHKQFSLDKRLSYGIPVQTKFSVHIDKQQAREQLGLADKPTVMMMSGGVGFGNVEKLVINLNKCKTDFQIVCVCGRNAKLKAQLEQLKAKGKIKHDITVYGFVNNVDVIMSAADVLIGKIGGVAIAEAFNKHLAIIANKHLPFQEHDNMLFLKARNACDYIDNPSKAYKVVDSFFTNKERLADMHAQIEQLRRPNAAKDIGDLLYNGLQNN